MKVVNLRFESYVIYALGKAKHFKKSTSKWFESYVIYALGKTADISAGMMYVFESYVIYALGKIKSSFSFIYIEFK